MEFIHSSRNEFGILRCCTQWADTFCKHKTNTMRILFILLTITIISCTQNKDQLVKQEEKSFEGLDFSSVKYSDDLFNIDSIRGFVRFPRITISDQFDTVNHPDTYFGLYQNVADSDSLSFIWRRLNVIKVVEETLIGTNSISYFSDSESNPLLMLSGISVDGNNIVYGKAHERGSLNSNDHFELKFSEFNYTLYLKNTNEITQTGDTIGNLSLWINKTSNKNVLDTAICTVMQRPWNDEFEGNIGLYWIGDMDFDGLLDMVIGFSDRYNYYEYRLYLSSVDEFNPIAKFSFSD